MLSHLKRYCTAHVDVFKWLSAGYSYQKLPSKKIKKIPGVYNGSLIWAYFIRKKKHFSEIIKLKK